MSSWQFQMLVPYDLGWIMYFLYASVSLSVKCGQEQDLVTDFPWGLNEIMHGVQFSRSVMSDSLRPQHTRPPCPSPTPRAYSNSCPSCQWCHPTISPSVIPFFPCLQPFPASGYFQMSEFFASGGQIIGDLASTSVLPMDTQDWSPLAGLVGSPCSPRDAQESSPTPQFKRINSLTLNFLYSPTLTSIHDYWKNHNLD